MNRSFKSVVAAAVLLGAAPIVSLPAPFGPAPARADGPAPRPAQRQAEIAYLRFSIDHHAMGVEMGMIGLERATDPRLIAVSADIVAAQAAEVAELQGYLRDWYGITYEPQMTPADQADLDMLNALPEGEEFDVEYATMFIEHHRYMIQSSIRARPRFDHHALRQFATRVIVAQTAEIFHVFLPVLHDYRDHR